VILMVSLVGPSVLLARLRLVAGASLAAVTRSGTNSGTELMDIGVVLQTTPPAARVIDLAKRAETYGFSHVWTFDSHILWEEPYVIYSKILDETRNVIVGPMVTNPATRDWTVTASTYATLNEMYGNRTVCGIGRGDSAVRVTNGKPTTLATMGESIHVIRELANGRSVDYKGSTITLPWATKSRLDVYGAGYGPRGAQVDRRDLRRVHPAAGRSVDRRVDDRRRPYGCFRRRARPRRDHGGRRRTGLRGR
jgi:alkanesulfonate monooxygenase SsuD/methylene tetrahydromethanopterin reductase-like flavin-dependent oxidoreductase (luciferase family)